MKPRIGVLLGDPNGIGPELAAKLLSATDVRERADIVVIGDPHVFQAGQRIAGVSVPVVAVENLAETENGGNGVVFLERATIEPSQVTPGQATAEAGRSCLEVLKEACRLSVEGTLDGFCFAPLNKYALKLGGNPYGDEHILFAREIGFDGPFCEHNTLGDLWTTRVTSHIPIADVAANITRERVLTAIQLAHNTLGSAGYDQPRLAVAGLNPHAGDGGMFGLEEIDIIAPAIDEARALGVDATGPFAADTVFIRARDGDFDAVVTMYHDQGQVAMKLMGFERGVTVSGGLPIPITTPASGTAFDIVGQGKAKAEGLRQAFLLVCKMAEIRRNRTQAPDMTAA